MRKAQVLIMGLGYIGLPTAALIAGKGIAVSGFDVNPKVVQTINQGKIHITEPDLEGLVHLSVMKGFLKAVKAPQKADVFILAVPTPLRCGQEPDISYVETAITMIIPFLAEGNLVIIESTVPVGTTDKMAELIFTQRPELKGKVYIAYCPERVLPGKILYELEHNDRVIGGLDKESAEKAKEFYALFVNGALHRTSAKAAEMCKLVENAYRDVNIAFANELSIICEQAGVDAWEMIELASKHPRVNILKPGPGVGGHCIAVDPWFIVHKFPGEAKLIKAAREVNDYKPQWVVQRIKEKAQTFERANGKKPLLGVLGLAYKPDIDDLRESPALEIVKTLTDCGYDNIVNEPNISEECISNHKNVDLGEVLARADIIVILAAHSFYKNSQELIKTSKIIMDFTGMMANKSLAANKK